MWSVKRLILKGCFSFLVCSDSWRQHCQKFARRNEHNIFHSEDARIKHRCQHWKINISIKIKYLQMFQWIKWFTFSFKWFTFSFCGICKHLLLITFHILGPKNKINFVSSHSAHLNSNGENFIDFRIMSPRILL